MRMYLSVIGNPYFAVTGKDGTFSLTGLPPGTYTVAAVHEKCGEQDEMITLATRQNKTGMAFSFKE